MPIMIYIDLTTYKLDIHFIDLILMIFYQHPPVYHLLCHLLCQGECNNKNPQRSKIDVQAAVEVPKLLKLFCRNVLLYLTGTFAGGGV